jgi:hypothetical protein
MEKKLMDIETFKQSVIKSHALRKLDHVSEWIEVEGKRLVDEHALKNFRSLMNYFPLTIKDFNWLKEGYRLGIYRELALFEKHGTDTGIDEDIEIVVYHRENQGRPYMNNNEKFKTNISYIQLLPMDMTHLWGGGYYSIVENSLLKNDQLEK